MVVVGMNGEASVGPMVDEEHLSVPRHAGRRDGLALIRSLGVAPAAPSAPATPPATTFFHSGSAAAPAPAACPLPLPLSLPPPLLDCSMFLMGS